MLGLVLSWSGSQAGFGLGFVPYPMLVFVWPLKKEEEREREPPESKTLNKSPHKTIVLLSLW